MASPNTIRLRLAQAPLAATPQFVVRREVTAVGKSGRYRVRTIPAAGAEFDMATGAHRNPARAMSETERRAAGLRRNGQPRRSKPATP